ncbi:MAG: hypothetical protein ACTIA3_06580 [Corynebacterium casei]|uniref:hypothetical protein n=2 Tax=Corynebacterium casei TaxID=160386 RepID=UPI003F8E8BCA
MTQHSPTAAHSPAPQGTLLGIFAVLGAAALWGTTGTAATFAPEVGPLAMGAAALGIGGLLQALIALPALYRARVALRANIGTVIAGGGCSPPHWALVAAPSCA